MCDLVESRRDLATFTGIGEAWPKVSVVIPALNEARNLPHVFAKLPDGLHEVIVVDGNSVDDTVATARRLRPGVRIVTQNRCGKGNALACGFAAATGDIIAMVDADGSADPAEILQFVRALLDGADFAKGTRFAVGGGSSDITRLRRLGNRMLSGLVNVLCRTKYSDLCYGYNAFWRRHVPVFGLDTESDVPSGSGAQAVGRRIRGRDLDQRPHRPGRAEGDRGRELRAFPDPRRQQPERRQGRLACAAYHPGRALLLRSADSSEQARDEGPGAPAGGGMPDSVSRTP